MNIVNEPVRHRQFGPGTITGQTLTTVTVEFCEEHETKKFQYPFAFETFLELSNPAVKLKMEDELRENRKQKELERQRLAEEEELRQEEMRRILLELKHKAVKNPSSSKKSKAKPKAKE
ncbi:MAG TPA: hypothetical protein PKA19_12925 [Bacillota bacterium]|nr:hypothetical protein [Bacillota bacterium]